jgi:hypothetical protein
MTAVLSKPLDQAITVRDGDLHKEVTVGFQGDFVRLTVEKVRTVDGTKVKSAPAHALMTRAEARATAIVLRRLLGLSDDRK